MTLDRRSAIRQLLFISAGSALLPSCLHHAPKASIVTNHFKIDGNQEQLVKELSEAILPTANTPGAAPIPPQAFIFMMLDDCYFPEDQEKFLTGLTKLEEAAKEIHGNSFTLLSATQKEAFLTGIETKYIMGNELAYCYAQIKTLSIQAYTTSPYFLTKVQVYELVPGRWHGCVPVKNNSKNVG